MTWVTLQKDAKGQWLLVEQSEKGPNKEEGVADSLVELW
jgi:hypothetical protein